MRLLIAVWSSARVGSTQIELWVDRGGGLSALFARVTSLGATSEDALPFAIAILKRGRDAPSDLHR